VLCTLHDVRYVLRALHLSLPLYILHPTYVAGALCDIHMRMRYVRYVRLRPLRPLRELRPLRPLHPADVAGALCDVPHPPAGTNIRTYVHTYIRTYVHKYIHTYYILHPTYVAAALCDVPHPPAGVVALVCLRYTQIPHLQVRHVIHRFIGISI
jgi:hypothetical protein